MKNNTCIDFFLLMKVISISVGMVIILQERPDGFYLKTYFALYASVKKM